MVEKLKDEKVPYAPPKQKKTNYLGFSFCCVLRWLMDEVYADFGSVFGDDGA